MAEARLYYEAHITVKKPPPSTWEPFRRIAELEGFRASRFDVDEVDHYDGAWFLSYRQKSLQRIKERIYDMLEVLRKHGWEPIRWKIEDTVMDSKHGDTEKELIS